MAAYPPNRHLLRDLQLSMIRAPRVADRVLMPVCREILSASGSVSLGALAVAVDLAAAGVAFRTIAPDWLATAELEIHAQNGDPGGLIVAEPALLRRGRTTTVFEVAVTGYPSEHQMEAASGTPIAHSTMTFVRIARPDMTSELDHPSEPTETTRVDFALPESGLRKRFFEELGLRTVDAASGSLEMAAADFTQNSFGSLQGGIVATLAQAACEAATEARCRARAAATDLSVHYLAQGSGPYATRAALLRGTDSSSLHRVEILDIETNTLMATATTSSSIVR